MADDADNERPSDPDRSDDSDGADGPADGESTDGGPTTDDPGADGVDESDGAVDAESDDATSDDAASDDTEYTDAAETPTDEEVSGSTGEVVDDSTGEVATGDDDGQEDWSGESFDASDLVAGGEYIGNDEDSESVTHAGEDGPRPPDGDERREPPDVELPERPDGELAEPPDGELAEPPDGDGLPSEPETITPDTEKSGFSQGARPDSGEYERPDNMAEATPIERKTGPPEDQEMPLADHVEEMVSRLFIIIAIAGVVSVAIFPLGEEIIDFLWYQVLPGGDVAQPRVYHPLALVMTQLKVASLGGLIIALPVFVYQTYAFMKPGLYPNERRYYLAAIPTSLVLAFVGVTFAFFVILPAIFTYFLYYSDTVVTIAFALSDTFNLILLLMGYLAIVFQIPLFIMLAIMMGLVTRRWMENRRLYFWAAFLGISFIFNPDPTGMAPFLVTITMITLFEGTLLLLRWTGR